MVNYPILVRYWPLWQSTVSWCLPKLRSKRQSCNALPCIKDMGFFVSWQPLRMKEVSSELYVTQGPKTSRLSFSAFLLNHILHCFCFKILFTESKYLVSNWSYTHLIRAVKKVKKLNKKFKIFHAIKVVHNHYYITCIMKLFWVIKGFILYQIKQTALILGYYFTTSGKFTDTSWIEELQNRKSFSPIWASSSISRKRQATGFEPLRHICLTDKCDTRDENGSHVNNFSICVFIQIFKYHICCF